MIINLIPDDSVASAPAGFTQAIQAAANIFDSTFTENITINIRYGWGTYNNSVDQKLTNTTGAEGAPLAGATVNYSTLENWLGADETSSNGITAINSLPQSNSAFPDSANTFYVSSAQEKALGQLSGDNSAVDGAIGFGTASGSSFWEEAALHEIAHAMGRTTYSYVNNVPTIMDLFRYNSKGTFQWTGGQAAYLSIDGGNSSLANFDTTSDYGDFTVHTPSDPFDYQVDGSAATLTSLDIELMGILGFGANVWVGSSGDFATGSNWITGSVPKPGTGAALTGTGTYTVKSAADETVYSLTTGESVTLDVIGGTFTVTGAATNAGTLIADGGTLVLKGALSGGGTTEINGSGKIELGGAASEIDTFEAATGTLQFDDAKNSTGTISNFVPGDTIDLAGIGLATSATLGANNVLTVQGGSGGPLTLNFDPTQDYSGDNFLVNDDSNGGTNISVASNVPPVTTVPGAQTVVSGVPAFISGISVADTDAVSAQKTITVMLSDKTGLLSASGGGTISGEQTTSLTLSGTLSQVNADLSSLQYVGFAPGSDSIDVATGDGRGGSDDHKIPVTIVNNGPSSNQGGGLQTWKILVNVTWADGSFASGSYEVTNTATNPSFGSAVVSNVSINLTVAGIGSFLLNNSPNVSYGINGYQRFNDGNGEGILLAPFPVPWPASSPYALVGNYTTYSFTYQSKTYDSDGVYAYVQIPGDLSTISDESAPDAASKNNVLYVLQGTGQGFNQNPSYAQASGSIISVATNATLNGVTNPAGSTFTGPDGSSTGLFGTVTNDGTLFLDSTGDDTQFQVSGNTTLTGLGSVQMSNSAQNFIVGLSGQSSTITVAAGQTVEGSGQIGGGAGSLGLINQGIILADQSIPLVVASPITNNGLMNAVGGKLEVQGAVAGTGAFTIGDPSVLEFDGPVSSGQAIDMAGPGATLILTDPSEFAGTISGFAAGDIIDFNITGSANFRGTLTGGGTLVVSGGGALDVASAYIGSAQIDDASTLEFAGTYVGAATFSGAPTGPGGMLHFDAASSGPINVVNPNDIVIAQPGGNDWINATVDYILPTNIDALFLYSGSQGAGNNDASGDALFALDTVNTQTLTGNSPNDAFVVFNSSDVVVPKAGSHDVVYAPVSFTLPTGVETLILEGTATQGVGNSDAVGDALYAASPNQAATLTGNSANDVFVVYNSSDVVVPKMGSNNSVYAAVNCTLPTRVDVLFLEAGTQGVGNSDASGDALYAADAGTTRTLTGNSANDVFVVYNSSDVVVPKAGSHDTVYSAVNYTLPTGVDTLFLEAGTQAAGNSDAAGDVLYAANAGIAQTLTGNSANDTFVVYNSADIVIGQAGSTDTVYAAASFTLPTNVDTLFLEGSSATHGTGNSGAADTLFGNAGVASSLIAGSGADTLYVTGTAGTILTGGTGADTFAFPNAMGHDEVTNFGLAKDMLQFNATLFSNFTAAMNAASQVGANTVFTIDANDTVTLDNVTKSSLTAGSVHFV